MPNNLDMGGFGSPGLPVRSGLNGAVRVELSPWGAPATTYPAEVTVGGRSLFRVTANGNVYSSSYGQMTATQFEVGSGIFQVAGYVQFHGGGSLGQPCTHYFNYTGLASVPSTGSFGWSSGSAATGSTDVALYRGGAGILQQYNGTNAQTSRIYGTYTDASNYVRVSLSATSTTVTLAAETAGTGADNVPVVITPAGISQVEVGNGVQFTEMTAPSAPAANKVILYAVDNGAGKTQLMALFPSGAAQQVAIEP